ncbi:hypothetical protein FQR65_LT19968 [Abscondita terminalis]|nr:hypothetical protein FQR65_LT19968 [Abscondita terminalis]
MAASTASTARQSPMVRIAPPTGGATSGPRPTNIAMRLIARIAAAPSDRSTAMARETTTPADPAMPCTARSAMNTVILGENTIAMLASANTVSAVTSTGLRPHWSESGPSMSCPAPIPTRNAVSVSCTDDGCAPSSPAMLVNEARYMSLANGPTAARKESTPSRPGDPTVMALATREDLRNVAIVAHVDHGKTTLVDAMLRQTNSFDAHAEVDDRVMDSNDLEREKGITILAKNTAISYEGAHAANGPIVINVVDTPGHADFGGEVERALSMVDGVVLLVDASEGPLPQTRFVLRKALEAKLPVILAVNKTDRPDARIEEVEGEAQDLLLGLASDLSEDHPEIDVDAVLDVPTVYLSGRAGAASHNRPADGSLPDNPDLEPLFQTILERVPAPSFDDAHPLQAHVTNLDSSPFLGRIALLRVHNGWIKKGETVAWVKHDGSVQNVRITELMLTKALTRYPADKAGPGDIVAIAGIEDITIGETIADAEDVRPLPTITVDEPAISMTIGANTSPLVGKVKGHKLTARMIKDRLDRELIGNVSLRVVDTGRPDAWEVQGRGELALAILVENMRREGFELTVGKPQVVTRQVNGKTHEPYEHLTIDTPEEHLGAITQLLAARKGRMENMVNNGTGWVRMEFIVPSRGLIGFRSEFHDHHPRHRHRERDFARLREWAGVITTRNNGSIVADRAGVVTPFAIIALQERMTFFVQPTQEVYGGMVIGENSRNEDMDVNITKEKKLTNMRSSTADSFESMTPPRTLTLEECLEFAREDECVEVTPEVVRIRKVELDANLRARAAARLKNQQ